MTEKQRYIVDSILALLVIIFLFVVLTLLLATIASAAVLWEGGPPYNCHNCYEVGQNLYECLSQEYQINQIEPTYVVVHDTSWWYSEIKVIGMWYPPYRIEMSYAALIQYNGRTLAHELAHMWMYHSVGYCYTNLHWDTDPQCWLVPHCVENSTLPGFDIP